MPKKSKRGKRKGKKGGKKKKKEKKEKPIINPPPLHALTDLYNKLRDKLFDLKRAQGVAKKKRLEGWFMTREMLAMKHDNDVYHNYLQEKMEDLQRIMDDILAQLEKEKAEVDRLIRERLGDYDKKLAEYKHRIQKGETELADLRVKLLEFEPLMKKLAALQAKLRELQALIPAAELEANVKTRHLKNQYLNERAKLHNHLENELFNLISTCRSHLMPILADHMNNMQLENKCNRWELGRLDIANSKLTRQKDLLLERRDRLNIERPYWDIQWAFNKLAHCEARRREEYERKKNPDKALGMDQDCELAVSFKKYLNGRLNEEEYRRYTGPCSYLERF